MRLKRFQFPVVFEVSINTLKSKSTSEILMEIKDQAHNISNVKITAMLISPQQSFQEKYIDRIMLQPQQTPSNHEFLHFPGTKLVA